MKEKKRFDLKIPIITFVLLALLILFIVDYTADTSPKLSELQTVACEVADDAGTCATRLPGLGIVLQEECCQILGKCCG